MTAKSVKFLLILFSPGKFQLVYKTFQEVYKKFQEVRWNEAAGGP